MRLNRHIADTGFSSRREADRLIAEGRVTVNGIRARMGMELAPQTPAQFDRYVSAEFIKWAKVMKSAGIEPN